MAKKTGSRAKSTGTNNKRSAGGSRAKSSSSSSAPQNKSKKSGRAASSKTETERRKQAREKARLLKEQREREIRMDVTIVVMVIVTAFLFLSLLGFGGSVGQILGNILFGLFGVGAWAVPFYMFAACYYMVSGRGGRYTAVRLAAVFILLLVLEAAGHLWLYSSGKILFSKSFSALETFHYCSDGHCGGGVAGGFFAWLLYYLFRMICSWLILAGISVICLILLIPFSPTAALRAWSSGREDDDRPGFAERRALYRQRRLEELEREEEERLERETDRILRREERQAEKELDALRAERRPGRSGRFAGKKRDKEIPLDLENTLIGDESGRRPGEHTGAGSRRKADRMPETGAAGRSRKDVHEIRVTSDREEVLYTIADSADSASGSAGTRENRPGFPLIHGTDSSVEPEGTRFVHYDPGRRADSARTDSTRTDSTGSDSTRTDSTGSDSIRTDSTKADTLLYDDMNGSAGDTGPEMDTGELKTGSSDRAVQPGQRDDARPARSEQGETRADTGRAPSGQPQRQGDRSPSSPGHPGIQTENDRAASSQSAAVRAGGAGERPVEEAGLPAKEDLDGITVTREKKKSQLPASLTGRIRGRSDSAYVHPPFNLLEKGSGGKSEETERELKLTAHRLQETLRTFGVEVSIKAISQGPSVTRYELEPKQGVKVSRIVNLSDDIKLRLAATDIRIEAPIPGKSAIGIEVPNKHETTVHLRELIDTREFVNFKGRLPFAVGKDISGKSVYSDIARMPHLLIAGATGSGKSVCINTIILSILYSTSPDDVKLLMIDPKVVELSVYKGIPHLIIPVVTDARKASAALNWAVAEMEKRYKLFAAAGVRDLNGFNALASSYTGEDGEPQYDPLPRLIVIVDELADLMMVAKSEVEGAICRLAQLARAAGIHLIIATQRPSVDVITGLIKANMPSRIAFAVSSQVDSRTILDMAGAEKLIGRGDMLFYPQNYQKPARIQGAFVSDEEVTKVVDDIKKHNVPARGDRDVDRQIEDIAANGPAGAGGGDVRTAPGRDEYFEDAGRYIIEKNKASIGLLQRIFKIGFNRAARIMDQLAEAGVVSEESSTRARQVLMSMPEFEAFLEENT